MFDAVFDSSWWTGTSSASPPATSVPGAPAAWSFPDALGFFSQCENPTRDEHNVTISAQRRNSCTNNAQSRTPRVECNDFSGATAQTGGTSAGAENSIFGASDAAGIAQHSSGDVFSPSSRRGRVPSSRRGLQRTGINPGRVMPEFAVVENRPQPAREGPYASGTPCSPTSCANSAPVLEKAVSFGREEHADTFGPPPGKSTSPSIEDVGISSASVRSSGVVGSAGISEEREDDHASSGDVSPHNATYSDASTPVPAEREYAAERETVALVLQTPTDSTEAKISLEALRSLVVHHIATNSDQNGAVDAVPAAETSTHDASPAAEPSATDTATDTEIPVSSASSRTGETTPSASRTAAAFPAASAPLSHWPFIKGAESLHASLRKLIRRQSTGTGFPIEFTNCKRGATAADSWNLQVGRVFGGKFSRSSFARGEMRLITAEPVFAGACSNVHMRRYCDGRCCEIRARDVCL